MSGELIKKVKRIPNLEEVIGVCMQFDLGDLISISEIIENTANVNVKIITSKGTYVIRVFSSDSQRCSFIINILNNLQENKLPVLMPIKDIYGQSFTSFGNKTMQVTRFIEGSKFNGGRNHAISSGRTLRRFHDVLSNIDSVSKPRASLYPSTVIIKEGIKRLENIKHEISMASIELIGGLYRQIIERWEVKCGDLPRTIIHGDWNQGNQLYSDSGDVCCIMDFDFMSRAERLFDIAYTLWHFRIHNEPLTMAKAFMEGYGPITSQEISLLPLEIARINFFFICTSTLSLNPKYELENNILQQYPFIKWALSKEGEQVLANLCEKK